MVNKHKQKKKYNFRSYGKIIKKPNAVIGKISEIRQKQEEEKDRKTASALPGNSDFRWWKQKDCFQLCRKRRKWKNLRIYS